MAKGPGGFGDMGGILKQAQKMQRDMERLKSEVGERIVEGTAGGEMVRVHVNGNSEIVAVKIDPKVVDPDDTEMLEDLVAAAANAGIKKAKEMMEKEMGKLTGGLGLPGFPGL